MQKISKMALACGLLLVLIIGSVEMYVMSPPPMQHSNLGNAFTAPHRQRFTRQPHYFLNQNLQADSDMLLFQQSQQNPRFYGMDSLFNIQQQPIYQHQAPPQALPRYAPTPKKQEVRTEPANNVYRPLHVNIDPQTTQTQSSSNKDFLSTIEFLDNQGRPSNLKDLGIGSVEGQMYNPELAEQLISIFEKINHDLLNADFVPLDVDGANQQIGQMFQNQYNQQQDVPAVFQSNPAEQNQQKTIEYKTISTRAPTVNYTTPVVLPEDRKYQYLKPVRSYRANAQHLAQPPKQTLNVEQLPIANEQSKQYGIQNTHQFQLLKPTDEKHHRHEYSKPSPPIAAKHDHTANNFLPSIYQFPQTIAQPIRITQRPPIFDNAPIVQKDVANDEIGFNNDRTPILPARESAISLEKPMVPQVVSFDSRINSPPQQENSNRVANERPTIPLSQPINFQNRPDIWIPMSMHPVQHKQNFFRYESAAPLNQAIVQQKEQFDHDERLNVPQMVAQEQESFSNKNQNEQIERKQQPRISQSDIRSELPVQNNKELSQQKELQQQQEHFDSQLDNRDEQQKLFDGSFGDSFTASPVVRHFEDSSQSKSIHQISTSLINSLNSQPSDSDRVNSNLQPFNQQKIDHIATQQRKEDPFEDQQQQEVISQKKELDISAERSNGQQPELQQQEELEPVITTTIPSTTTTTTTTTSAPTTISKSTTARLEQTKTRKVRIQSKNRSPIQIQKNSLRQQSEAKKSASQQLIKQTVTAVPEVANLIGQKLTQPAATDRPVPRLATRRFIVKSPRSKRPPPAVVKQQQSLQEQFSDNKNSQAEQTSSELPKVIQGQTSSNVNLLTTASQQPNFPEQQNSNEDVVQERASSKEQQQQKEERVSLTEESNPSFTEQTKMDVTSRGDDEFLSKDKSADIVTTPGDIVTQQKDGLSIQKEEVLTQQKKDSTQQTEVLPAEQQDEISQERDTLSPTQEPVQTVTQQQEQQQQQQQQQQPAQEDVMEQQKEVTTTEVVQSQQQFVTSAQLDSDKSQTEQRQDQDSDLATNKSQSQTETAQAQQQPVEQEKQQQQQTFDSTQSNDGLQADEEVSAQSTTRRPPTRFFSPDEQKELAQEKDTAAPDDLSSNERAEQKNLEKLTAKLARTRNAQLTTAADRKRAQISSSGRRHSNHHELSSHQLTDTYNPLQFEPERIVSPKNAAGSLQNIHVNLSDSY